METVWEEEEQRPTRRYTLAERLKLLEKKQKLKDRGEETEKKVKEFKFPFTWRWKFNQAKRKNKSDMMLVFFLNKKNEIEPPKFMPVFDGNMIVWKNKPYEFDPRAIWTLKMKGFPRVYLIKEIDRRPVRNHKGTLIYTDSAVSNMDLDDIRLRGDSTESDEFLIKAALKAQTQKIAKSASAIVIVVIILIVLGALAWFMFGGGGG